MSDNTPVNDNAPEKAELADRELNAVAGGGVAPVRCPTCGNWYYPNSVKTKKEGCLKLDSYWYCPRCEKWN